VGAVGQASELRASEDGRDGTGAHQFDVERLDVLARLRQESAVRGIAGSAISSREAADDLDTLT
jgi:hypothetical protein